MTGSTHSGFRLRTRTTRTLTAGALVLAAGLATTSIPDGSYAAGQSSPAPAQAERSPATGEARGFYDVRVGVGSTARAAQLRTSSRASSRPAARALRKSLPDDALVEYDGTTGTVRVLENLDGFLTGPSSEPVAKVAMQYVTDNHDALGLTSADLRTFRLRRDYRDITGTHHLSWVQNIGGDPVFGNGLRAAVDRQGRLLMVGGSPVSSPPAPRRARRTLGTPSAAIAASRRDTGERSTTPGPRDAATRVLFVTREGSFAGWETITMSADQPTLSVLDAASGRLLYRRPLSSEASAGDPVAPRTRPHSAGLAFLYFPKHRPGGSALHWNFTDHGWLPKNAQRLSGNNSHTYSDVDDNNRPSANEEVGPSGPHRWNYRLQPFHLGKVSFCDHPYPCSWNPNKRFSWRVNRKQNATQVFFFVNRWHDHLKKAPIGFTEAAGNFQTVNATGHGKGRDAVDTQTDDGANTDHGLPDGAHIDNANMDTPPDGIAPTMQMYLQHQPGTPYPDGDPFAPTNVGDEADTVYHEYTHGLSNRLVVDARGISTLGGVQAGAMGEAWSDWYAMDDLVARGLQKDDHTKADVVLYQYDGEGVFLDRTEPIDCAVGSASTRCNGGLTGHGGGYTYADYGKVSGSPEVHSDGEIWGQALWSLRYLLHSKVSESLVTRAMELAPGNPSFLDMRNAILVADTAVYGGEHHAAIWQGFASRGMGYFAGSLGGDDIAPGASTDLPPATSAEGTISGVVRDDATGQPLANVPVTLAFQGGAGTVNPTTVSASDGSYTLGPVPAGTYPELVASLAGYDIARTSVTVAAGGTTKDLDLRRDWAASSGGATISDFTGPDFGPGCGPPQAIDGSQASGWGTTTGDDFGDPTNVFEPKSITIDLARNIDVTQFGVDPSATCGDGGSASTGQYRIETSPDGTDGSWTTADEGTFTVADRGRINLLPPSAGATGVRFVKFTILGNQTPDFATSCPDGAYSGCSFTDLTEIEVYGAEAP